MTDFQQRAIFTPESADLPFGQPLFDVRQQNNVMVAMRDGVRLAIRLYFPVDAPLPAPLILIRTPYDKDKWREEYYGKPGAEWFASQGYAVAIQDKRGKFRSEGTYVLSGGDVEDTEDTVNWLASQPWCNGRIAMFGCSYLGEIQIRHAPLKNPHVKALCPHAAGGALGTAGGRYAYAATRNGGAMELAQMLGWFYQAGAKHPGQPDLPAIDLSQAARHLPTRDIMNNIHAPDTDWVDAMTRSLTDPWWEQFGYLTGEETIDVPVLHINTWYDYGVAQTIDTWQLFKDRAMSELAARNQFLILAPTDHCKHEMVTETSLIGERALGDMRFDFHSTYFRWFARWLRDDEHALDAMPPVQYFLMGKNVWCSSSSWPPPGTEIQPWYLHSDGHANSSGGDGSLSCSAPGTEPADEYTYDPQHPVPSVGGPLAMSGQPGLEGAYDQRENELRPDVLVYSSEILQHGVEVCGPLKLRLYVSSSAVDTDFTAKLVDVYPDGRVYNIQEGILRARFREGFDREVFMQPGEVYTVEIDLQATANWFGPGHRIRLEVSSSNFPRFDRNLNTGGRNFDETEGRCARNTVHHSAGRASCLMLPVRSE